MKSIIVQKYLERCMLVGTTDMSRLVLTIGWMIRQIQEDLVGTFHLLFQPAEESGQGALQMVRKEFSADQARLCFGRSPLNEKPFGWLGITGGALMAASSTFQIKVIGKGGHGGQPPHFH